MPISIDCPGCSAKLNVPDTATGKKVKCPKCHTVTAVGTALPPEPAFEAVEEPPAPKPTAKPKAVAAVEEDERPRKKPVKAAAEVDEDDDEPKPKSKKARALAQDDDDRPRKKKAAGTSTARNLIGGAVLVALLVVVGIVYAAKFGGDKEKELSPNASSGDTPTPGPTPGRPKPPTGEPNPYTGEGIREGAIGEWEGEVDVRYQKSLVHDDHLLTVLRGLNGTTSARVFVRPDQLRKVDELWTGQKVKIRGRRVENVATAQFAVLDFFGAEILSVEPPPPFTESTVDALLAEFRADKAAAAKKYATDHDGKRPWVKLTGTFDGTGDSESGFGGFRLKGAAPDGTGPQRVFVHQPELERPTAKDLKPGQPITVRVSGYVKVTEKEVEFGNGLLPLPNPAGASAKVEPPKVNPKPPEPKPPAKADPPRLPQYDVISSLFIAGEGKKIAVSGASGGAARVRAWDIAASPNTARQWDAPGDRLAPSLAALTGDGQTLAVVGWGEQGKYVCVFWSVANGRRISSGEFAAGGPLDRATTPAFNFDGTKLMVVVGADVAAISVFTGKADVKKTPKKFGYFPVYHPGLHRVVGVGGTDDGRGAELLVWDPVAGGEAEKVRLDTKQTPAAFAMSVDGKVLAVTTSVDIGPKSVGKPKSRVTLYDAASGKALSTLAEDDAPDFRFYEAIVLSGDGKYLAGLGFGPLGSKFRTLDLFRVSDGKRLHRASGDKGGEWIEFARSPVFSPDQRSLYYASLGTKVVRIDTETLTTETIIGPK